MMLRFIKLRWLNPRTTEGQNFRRRCVKVFFFLLVTTLVIDVFPRGIPGSKEFPVVWDIKVKNSYLVNALGIWQGEWPLFAPEPVINNGGLSAELTYDDGTIEFWESSEWSRASVLEKFTRFRHMNYYTRLGASSNYIGCSDFIDYLQRSYSKRNELGQFREVVKVKIYDYRKRMIRPQDQPFPKPDETIWVSVNSLLQEKSYNRQEPVSASKVPGESP